MVVVSRLRGVLVLLTVAGTGINGKHPVWDKMPLREDEESRLATLSDGDGDGDGDTATATGTAGQKASECRFSDKRYMLEESWHPDLGPPFGVMYCVRCECIAVKKKRRVVGVVRCKNFKMDCPKVNCSEPVLLPGRCCKICPGENQNPDLMIEVDLKREEDEKNGRHYAALLGPKGMGLDDSRRPQVATGRFFFRKKSLSYSFVTSTDFGWPKLVTFLIKEGSEEEIIEEFPVHVKDFQKSTDKVCGSWQRIPRRYRQLLRSDSIQVQLTNNEGQILGGKISKHYGLSTELFSAMAVGSQGHHVVTAIVSPHLTSSDVGDMHVNLLIKGLFNATESKSAGVFVKFGWHLNDGQPESITEELMTKVSNELTELDFKTTFDTHALEALGKGRMELTVTSKDSSPKTVSGHLAPRYSCDFFDTILQEGEESSNVKIPKGLAWMNMQKNGTINYHIRVDSVTSEILSMDIGNGRKSRRLVRIIYDLLPSFVFDNGGLSGWANGTMTFAANDIKALYEDNLYIHVRTQQNDREIHGRIITQRMGPAQELSDYPFLISDSQERPVTSAIGIAWANVDYTCKLNYHIRLTTGDKKVENRLLLKDYPIKNLKADALVREQIVELQTFNGHQSSGYQDTLKSLTLTRMNSGDASLIIESKGDSPFVIEGRIRGVHPPPTCLPRYSRSHLELMPGYLSDLGEERPDRSQYTMKCMYEGQVYNAGDQWPSTHESCKMCSCMKGESKCEPILCPATNCTNPVLPVGECCAVCQGDIPSGNEQSCWFAGDKQFHYAGKKWHPYIPPFGFSRCTVCTCRPDSIQVECRNKKCPALNCPSKHQIRPDALACCKTCNVTADVEPEEPEEESMNSADPDRPHDMGTEITELDILSDGGCRWRDKVISNGAVWQPRVLPNGGECISCSCKDGKAKCGKKNCSQLKCRFQIRAKESCCPKCAETVDEIKKARKIQRLQKLRKVRQNRRLRQRQEQQRLQDVVLEVSLTDEQPDSSLN